MHETLDIPRDPAQELIVPAADLKQLTIDLLVKKGMFEVQAETAASRMVEADLRGIHSHGTRALPKYLEAMDVGDIDPRAQVVKERETVATAVLNGSRGIGHVAATQGMLLAIEKAREAGTGTVAVHTSHHCGAAGVYVLLAVEEGMIGYCTTNTAGPTVAAYGSDAATVANNAFAWAAPVRTGAPFVLDMACGISSWGKVESLKLYGQEMPSNWALDGNGAATVDPAAAKTILPAAGARGYGLALAASIIAGPLVGGKTPIHKKRKWTVESSEHFFYAIDVSKFTDLEAYYDEMDSTVADIRSQPPAEGFDAVRIPGELEAEREQEWQREGIPLHRAHVAGLAEVAASMKVAVPESVGRASRSSGENGAS